MTAQCDCDAICLLSSNIILPGTKIRTCREVQIWLIRNLQRADLFHIPESRLAASLRRLQRASPANHTTSLDAVIVRYACLAARTSGAALLCKETSWKRFVVLSCEPPAPQRGSSESLHRIRAQSTFSRASISNGNGSVRVPGVPGSGWLL